MEKENINDILDKYSLDEKDKEELRKIIFPIVNHYEFKKRITNKFPHHGSITLGEHIIEDAVLTYKLSKKEKLKNKNIRIDLAVLIAMFHDLYTIPWQNNKDAKVKHFFHKHGFRHPIEAVINSINWYPSYFKNSNDSKVIIDGILHHMYPLPVMRLDYKKLDYYEIKNISMFKDISSDNQTYIINSLNRKKIGPVSLSRSKYLEGRIMSKADKKVSRKQIKNFQSFKALLTGHNKKINKV